MNVRFVDLPVEHDKAVEYKLNNTGRKTILWLTGSAPFRLCVGPIDSPNPEDPGRAYVRSNSYEVWIVALEIGQALYMVRRNSRMPCRIAMILHKGVMVEGIKAVSSNCGPGNDLKILLQQEMALHPEAAGADWKGA